MVMAVLQIVISEIRLVVHQLFRLLFCSTNFQNLANTMPSQHDYSDLIPSFLALILACRLCAIYVREDNDFNV